MKNQGSPCVAILTGDIVRSSSLSASRRFDLFQALQELSVQVQRQYPNDVLLGMSKFRGDGWQMVIDQPQRFFEISLFIRTYIRARFKAERLDTRIAIAIGSVEFIPRENISEGYGTAFSESGKKLDELKERRMGVTLATEAGAPYSALFDALIRSYDTFITSWTTLQSQAVHLSLQGLTQKEVGARWQPRPIDQATVNRHLAAANWALVKEGIRIFETETTRIIQKGE